MKCLHLFNGIGGFALAADWMGWENVAHCEIDDFCNKVMNYHFPNSVQHEDIRTTDFSIYRGRIDVLTGGEPCQPHSIAGQKKGKEDERYLWPEYKRAVREILPLKIVNENVPGSIYNGVLDEKIFDLEALGYTCWPPFVISAGAFGADHLRERVWLVAYANRDAISNNGGKVQGKAAKIEREAQGQNRERRGTELSAVSDNGALQMVNDPSSKRLQDWYEETFWNREAFEQFKRSTGRDTTAEQQYPFWLEVASLFHGMDDGLSNRVDRIRAMGNAIVPQIAFEIFKAIEANESQCE